MRSFLRSWVRRWTARRTPSAKPRLVPLENKALPSGTAKGIVFRDANANGAQNNGEAGVANVTVTAYDAAGAIQGATSTIANGTYTLPLGGTGPYRLEFTNIPAGLAYGVQGSQAHGPVQFIDDGGGSNLGLALQDTVGATASLPIEIGDRLWLDANGDGIQDAAPSSGLSNVQVQLVDLNSNTVLGTATTDPSGRFLFNSGSGTNTSNTIYRVPLQPNGLYQLRVAVGQPALAGLGLSPFQVNSGANSNIRDSDGQLDKTSTFDFADFTIGGFGQGNPNIDFGFTPAAPLTATVGDFVWQDFNGDGIQQSNEPGLAGATVRLLDSSSNVVATTVSAANGYYSFSKIIPGQYRLDAALPAGFSLSQAVQGTDTLRDSDFDPTTGSTVLFTVAAGDTRLDLDAGATLAAPQTGSLGDFVWFDANLNGVQDAGEIGIINTVVNLYDSTGSTLVATTKTDAFGFYQLNNLAPGQYIAEFQLPPGFAFTAQNVGGNPTIDSDPDPATGRTGVITLAAGQSDQTIDAGVFKPTTGAVGDFVWNDLNCDGIQQPGEPGVPNVVVNLLDNTGATVATTTTDASGHYFFTNLNPGTYSVAYILPAGFVFTAANQGIDPTVDSNADAVTGVTGPIVVNAGTVNNTVDAGLCATATLGDFVWNDLNCDGIQQAGEPGVANVTVDLTDTTGKVLATTTTDGAGHYQFTNLAPGQYQVHFVLPGGFVFSPAGQGGNTALDSDANTATGRTATITLTPGQTDNDADAGLCQTGSLGDFVFFDQNCDGIQQPAEPGVPNVTVNLLDSGGATVATTTTDAAGHYQFTGLAPGNYSVALVLPAGFIFSPANQGGNAALDSDVNPATGQTALITLTPGQVNNDVDAGLCTATATLGDFVWLDLNCDGIQQAGEPGVAGVTVNLTDTLGNVLQTTTTDVTGHYLFSNLQPGNYDVQFIAPAGFAFTQQFIGADAALDSNADVTTGVAPVTTLPAGTTDLSIDAGLVTLKDVSGFVYVDANNNGIRDPGETPIPNVTITLAGKNDLGVAVTATTTTDAAGAYTFANLRPGTYSLVETQPAAFADGLDAAGTPFGGVAGNDVIDPIVVDCNPNNPHGVNYNFGEQSSSGIICGTVFCDDNNSGQLDKFDPPIAAAKVTLTGTDVNGNAIKRETYTGPTGTYIFTSLPAGTYTITVTPPPGFIPGPVIVGQDGGAAGVNTISDIVLAAGQTDCFNDFGQHVKQQKPSKKFLLASSRNNQTTLAGEAQNLPHIPAFANTAGATRYVVTAGDEGQAPLVRVYDFGAPTVKFEFMAYDPAFRGGVRVAVADVNGDGVPDIITAAGQGGGPHVKIFDGNTGNLISEFFAYDIGFAGGVYVAAADVNGDGKPEIITGAGPGGGPHVRIFNANGTVVSEYFAYDPDFTGGVRVAAGDVNGDGKADVITGAGQLGGPHVKVFNAGTETLLTEFFAFDQFFTSGVYVGAGDVNGDGKADIIVGSGEGGGSEVRIYSGLAATKIDSFFAMGADPFGVRVAAADIDGDGKADVITAAGDGSLPTITTIYDVAVNNSAMDAWLATDPSVIGGTFVAGG